jgi:hypothetical protein
MPAAHPEEFRRRAVELARLREKPIARRQNQLIPGSLATDPQMGQRRLRPGEHPRKIGFLRMAFTAGQHPCPR